MKGKTKTVKAWGRLHLPSKTLEYEWTDKGNSLFSVYATKGEAEMEVEDARGQGLDDIVVRCTVTYNVPSK